MDFGAERSSRPAGYQEGIQFRMLSWYVPLSKYPAGVARYQSMRAKLGKAPAKKATTAKKTSTTQESAVTK